MKNDITITAHARAAAAVQLAQTFARHGDIIKAREFAATAKAWLKVAAMAEKQQGGN